MSRVRQQGQSWLSLNGWVARCVRWWRTWPTSDRFRICWGNPESLPPLRGVVHAAGVLEDGLLSRQTPDQFARVLAPKSAGAWNLHQLTLRQPLDFFVMYSSAAALLGSPGQANHMAANAFLDGLARLRRAAGLPAVSIGWGAWSEIGAAEHNQAPARFQARGLGAIPSQGLEVLEWIWRHGDAYTAVMPVCWPAFLKQVGEVRLLADFHTKTAMPCR